MEITGTGHTAESGKWWNHAQESKWLFLLLLLFLPLRARLLLLMVKLMLFLSHSLVSAGCTTPFQLLHFSHYVAPTSLVGATDLVPATTLVLAMASNPCILFCQLVQTCPGVHSIQPKMNGTHARDIQEAKASI